MKKLMNFSFLGPLLTVLCLFIALSHFATASDKLSASHLGIARKAIAVLKVTEQFDMILPELSRTLKMQLTSINPNRADEISSVVDAETFAIVKDRVKLEDSAAKIYASHFSQDELKRIIAFYDSNVGRKMLRLAPQMAKEIFSAVEIWKQQISESLAANVQKRLTKNKP